MARFNSATAREMAAKSHAARLQRRTSGTQAAETFTQTPQGGPHDAVGAYVFRRLGRVRAQLDLVDKAFEAEATKATPDGQRLNWFAQAQERLSEQERLLSGRPLPGSWRPVNENRGKKHDWGIEMQPSAPVQVLPVENAELVHVPIRPSVGPVSIEYALAHGPDRRPMPAPQAPPTVPTTRTVVTTATAVRVPTVPSVAPVPIEVALRHRPAPLPAPTSPAPPSQKPG